LGNILRVLTEIEINERLLDLDGWSLDQDAIKREWIFKDYSEAMDFINMVAVIAENQNHHPQLFNVYNRVSLRFNTHDAKGITEKDIDIARAIDKL
jgi:4a-hydroxytetrahydrobiopterin dehydratase